MKRAIFVAAIFAAGFAGVQFGVVAADHGPVLTGGSAAIPNALVFMENANPAYCSASSGQLACHSGGTNQNLILAPSGTGVVLQSLAANQSVVYQAKNTDAADPNALAQFLATANWGDFFLNAYGAGRATTKYGVTLGGWAELGTDAGNGLIVGTRTATPLILGTNALNQLEIFSSGGASLGSNSDPGAGRFNAATGFSQGGTAGVAGSITVNTTTGTAVISVTPSTNTAVASVTCNLSSIQYKDWSGTNQTAAFCASLTVSTGSYVVSVSTGTGSFLTAASASSNTFSGGIRTN